MFDNTALQMFAGIYKDFEGKSVCDDFKLSKSKKSVDFLYILFIKIFQISL